MASTLADDFLDACVHNKLQIVKNLFHRLDMPTIEVSLFSFFQIYLFKSFSFIFLNRLVSGRLVLMENSALLSFWQRKEWIQIASQQI
jgi:hypothetical protein